MTFFFPSPSRRPLLDFADSGPLQEKPPGGSGRNFPEVWAKPLRRQRNFWKPNNEPHVDPDVGADWIGHSRCEPAAVQDHCKTSSRESGYHGKPCATSRCGKTPKNTQVQATWLSSLESSERNPRRPGRRENGGWVWRLQNL